MSTLDHKNTNCILYAHIELNNQNNSIQYTIGWLKTYLTNNPDNKNIIEIIELLTEAEAKINTASIKLDDALTDNINFK